MTNDNARPPFKLILALVALVALVARGQPPADQTPHHETPEITRPKKPPFAQNAAPLNFKNTAVVSANTASDAAKWSSL